MNETSIVSGDIPAFILPDNLLIRRYPADLGFMIDYGNYAHTTAIGIGPFGANVAKLLSTNSYCVESYEVLLGSTGCDTVETADIFAAVQKSHLLFIISGFEDSYCELLFHQLAETAQKAGVLITVGVVPEGDHWQSSSPEHFYRQSKFVDSLMYISDRSLNEKHLIMTNAEQRADLKGELIRDVIATISQILTQAVMVTVFFDEIETAFKSGVITSVGVGEASGAERGCTAATLAVKRLLEQQVCMETVTGAIAYLKASSSVTLDEYEGMSRVIHEHFPEGINIGKSLLLNESMGENVTVTIVAMHNGRS